MPSPKSGNAGNAVSPAAPTAPFDADDANPGAVEQIKATQLQTKTGKYGSTQVKPYKPPRTEEEKEKKKSWIEIELRDEAGKPVPGEPYEIVLPDGETVASGTLDENGFARVDGIDPGACKVTFPDQDKKTWHK
jgi:type VI secretion system secreted protein VgrG